MNRPLKKFLVRSSVSLLLGSQTLSLFPPSAQAQTVVGNIGCPAGTREGPVSLITNGNFATNSGIPGPTTRFPVPANLGFASDLPYRGDGAYPDDGNPTPNPPPPAPPANDGGGLSIENGPVPNANPVVTGRGVTVDELTRAGITPANPINTYLYSNPVVDNAGNSTFAPNTPPIIWQQTLGIRPNTYYNFKALFFNLVNQPGSFDPVIVLEAGTGVNPPFDVGNGSTVPGFPTIPNTLQAWIPIQFSFKSDNLNTIQLRIRDTAQRLMGDDFGITAIGLRECIPIIGVSKGAGTPIPNSDGTFTVPYTVTVRNFAPANPPGGPEFNLTNLQLTENLTTTFATATAFSVQSGTITSPTLTVNPAFNGTNSTNLIQGTDTLPAGSSATVSFNIIITPGTGPNGFGPFPNQVTATAISQGGTQLPPVSSSNGVNPDPNNTGVPNPPSPTIVSLLGNTGGSGAFRLVKRITNVIRNGSQLSGVNFSTFIDSAGDDDNAPGFAQLQPGGAPIGQINLDPNTVKLQSGDDVEYSVYYLSDGTGPAISVSLCDPIPLSTTLIANTTQVQRNNGAIATGGTVFAPLAPLPAGNTCPDASNQNGTVIFDLGTIANTAGNNFGLVRFRVRVN